METQEREEDSAEDVRSATERARTRASQAIGHVPEIAGNARRRAGQAGERLLGAFSRVRSGARSSLTGLQRLPDSGLRLLAAVSLGFGAGLRLAGARRLATLAGFAPASIFGIAIVSRPSHAQPKPNPARP